jgi:hypothetical protein
MSEVHHNYVLTDSSGKPRLRGTNDPGEFALAVDDKGRIRTLAYSLNGKSSKLIGTPVINNKRLVGWRDIELSRDARAKGWVLLDDLYKAEGRMQDCETVYEIYRRNRTRKSGKAIEVDEAYLPEALMAIRARGGIDNGPKLPPPQKKAKKSIEKTASL